MRNCIRRFLLFLASKFAKVTQNPTNIAILQQAVKNIAAAQLKNAMATCHPISDGNGVVRSLYCIFVIRGLGEIELKIFSKYDPNLMRDIPVFEFAGSSIQDFRELSRQMALIDHGIGMQLSIFLNNI